MASRSAFLKSLVKMFFTLVFLGGVAAFFAWSYLQTWLESPLAIPERGYQIELKSGQSLGHLTTQMSHDGVLTYPFFFKIYSRLKPANKIHAGEYFFAVGTTPKQLLDKLIRGEVILYHLTILEGWTYKQALDAISKEPLLEHNLSGKTPEEQRNLLGITETPLEGWFFPDTYSFRRYSSDIGLLKQAHQKMRDFLEREWEQRAEDLPYKNAYEALIMASIIERETGHRSERDKIAGVFVRRLARGMKLQTDPTVIYGMGDAYQGKISRKHLQLPTPYNTYVITGLPPTPIALPSAAAIRAALHPAPGNALYFVAKGDGTSEFSASLEEHNAAVRRYQLKRRADYRSTPPAETRNKP